MALNNSGIEIGKPLSFTELQEAKRKERDMLKNAVEEKPTVKKVGRKPKPTTEK